MPESVIGIIEVKSTLKNFNSSEGERDLELRRLNNIIKEHKSDFSGSLLITKGNEEIFSYSGGYENMTYRIENSIDTLFQTASATKIFTAVSVLQLIENGDFSLSDKVIDILASFKGCISDKVTVENLLNHTSGIADYFDQYDDACIENIWGRVPNSSIKNTEDFIPYFKDKESLFEAGERFDYCNANYILLGLIIEEATGKKYREYVRENIFVKYDLADTDFVSSDSTKQVAEAYLPQYDEEKSITGWRKNIFMVPFYGSPDGGAYSTVRDMDKFFRKLRAGEILSDEILKLMLNPSIPADEKGEEVWFYNFGLWFAAKKNKVISYGVSGGDPGVSVKVFCFTESDINSVILGNKDNCVNGLNNDIRSLIIKSF